MDTGCIRTYLDSMSQYQKDSLAAATLDLINGILAQPGGRELIEKKKAELGLTKKAV